MRGRSGEGAVRGRHPRHPLLRRRGQCPSSTSRPRCPLHGGQPSLRHCHRGPLGRPQAPSSLRHPRSRVPCLTAFPRHHHVWFRLTLTWCPTLSLTLTCRPSSHRLRHGRWDLTNCPALQRPIPRAPLRQRRRQHPRSRRIPHPRPLPLRPTPRTLRQHHSVRPRCRPRLRPSLPRQVRPPRPPQRPILYRGLRHSAQDLKSPHAVAGRPRAAHGPRPRPRPQRPGLAWSRTLGEGCPIYHAPCMWRPIHHTPSTWRPALAPRRCARHNFSQPRRPRPRRHPPAPPRRPQRPSKQRRLLRCRPLPRAPRPRRCLCINISRCPCLCISRGPCLGNARRLTPILGSLIATLPSAGRPFLSAVTHPLTPPLQPMSLQFPTLTLTDARRARNLQHHPQRPLHPCTTRRLLAPNRPLCTRDTSPCPASPCRRARHEIVTASPPLHPTLATAPRLLHPTPLASIARIAWGERRRSHPRGRPRHGCHCG